MHETFGQDFVHKTKQLAQLLCAQGARLACAESCTGGLLSAQLTAVAGASQWFEAAYITYSNAAKQNDLGVSAHTLERYGAVSEQTALEMAKGVLERLGQVDFAVSITGVAGPDGGTADKPVGMVCFAFARRLATGQMSNEAVTRHFSGSRAQIRTQAVGYVLDSCLQRLAEL